MNETIYLTISPDRVEKMTKNPPMVGSGQIRITLNINVPDKVFGKPQFESTLEVSDPNSEFEVEIKEIESQLQKLKNQTKNGR